MNFKNLSLIFGCVLSLSCLQAQELERWVIGSAGVTGTTAGEEVSFTVGELAIETEASGSYILNQGFHQSKTDGVTGLDDPAHGVEVTLFPNPTNGISHL